MQHIPATAPSVRCDPHILPAKSSRSCNQSTRSCVFIGTGRGAAAPTRYGMIPLRRLTTPLPMTRLRHILGLSILYASVLFAGVPALSCANSRPIHGCCPPQAVMPCQGGESGTPKATHILPGCAAGAQSTATIASAVPSSKIEKHPQRVDPPPLITSFARQAAVYAPFHCELGFTSPTYTQSHSALYLSTGRLRL